MAENTRRREAFPVCSFLILLLSAAPVFCDPLEPAYAGTSASSLEFTDSLAGAVTPAFKVVQGISDRMYNLMRWHLIDTILPDGLTRNLHASPLRDSSNLFNQRLFGNEARYIERLRQDFLLRRGADALYDPTQSRDWRAWAAAEQASVIVDAFKDTLIDRYELERFGRTSGDYASDRRNWNPGFLTMAGVLGGAFLYLNGVHAGTEIGRLKLGIDLPSGAKLREALQTGFSRNGLAALEFGFKNSPLTVATQWGLRAGNLRSDRVGVKYHIRY